MKISKVAEDAKLPTRKHHTDAGLDFYSLEDYTILPNETKIVRTGIAIELPKDTMGLIKPKSRHHYLIGAGVVDQDYRGEIKIKIFNTAKSPIFIFKGDPAGQLVIVPILLPTLEVVPPESLQETKRGRSGGINN